uniref:pentatricopeptide repeat-containing protein At4g04790, mitochondrial-like isoform X2 n=1 Tax=Erigeron canadensis TaxID=72917 RepID=UPI001CB9C6A1|nr:pentatricopeptide repeat-containing protein At4g04790, mitochondrial-like isoform X2 [Erigeron canadensis]
MSGKVKTLTTKLLNSVATSRSTTAAAVTLKNYLQQSNAAPAGTTKGVTLKNYLQGTNTSPVAVGLKPSKSTKSNKSKKNKGKSSVSIKPLSALAVECSIKAPVKKHPRALEKDLARVLSEHTIALSESDERDDELPIRTLDSDLDDQWSRIPKTSIASIRRKEVTRLRKQSWTFTSTQENHYGKLVRMCTHKLGANCTIQLFGKLHCETGVKDFNAMIEVCIEKARKADDEDLALEEFHRAYMVFEAIRERGLKVEEVTYGPFLMFIIDMGMVEEFHFFCKNIRKDNPDSLSRLAYYEMLLWIQVGDEEKIKTLISNDSDEAYFPESYLIALCEAGRQDEVLMLLEKIDIKKVSREENKERIFEWLGRLLLESYAKKFILELKAEEDAREYLLDLIYSYAVSLPNIQIEDIVLKFKSLQAELKIPSSSAYEKLVKTCCESLEVHLAIDLVDTMLKAGLNVPTITVNSLLTSCYTTCDYNLVYRIKSMIDDHDIRVDVETIRIMTNLCVKLKDFDGAYGVMKDLKKLNKQPTANMYNAIMGGYFRQKNFHKGNCNCEEDIIKYRNELSESGVLPTKHIFMALINAYAACGLFEKAKEVLLDEGIPAISKNEIKSVLVSALASNDQMADALELYDEIKQAEANLEPKATICLIEHLQSEGELSRLLQLLNKLHESEYWDDGCGRVILYCVRHKLMGPAIDLLKQRVEKSRTDEMFIDVIFDEVFCQIAEMEPTDVQFGLDLLQAIKDDMGIQPSRKSHDFLLSACVSAKDLERSFIVWKEYQTAGLPYNVLTSVRMYQALVASGAHKAAKILLENIPDDDPHVCTVIKASQKTFGKTPSVESVENNKKKKKKRK